METVGQKSRLLFRSPVFLLEIPSKFVSPPWQNKCWTCSLSSPGPKTSNPPPIHLLHGAWAGHFLFPDLGLRDLRSTLTVLHPRTSKLGNLVEFSRPKREKKMKKLRGMLFLSIFQWTEPCSSLSSFFGGQVLVILKKSYWG